MNNLEKEFVPYQESLELKELGFDEPCFTYYKNDQLSDILELVKNSEMKNVNNEVDNYISAPTFSQAFRWFREKYGHNGVIEGSKRFGFEWYIDGDEFEYIKPVNNYDTYEEAELASIVKLIEIVKNKKL